MPGIILCSRRWGIGSDDFVFPAAGELLVRTAWLLSLAIVLAAHSNRLTTCEDGHLLQIYYIGTLILLAGALLLSTVIMCVSARGSIVDDIRRYHIPSLLYLRLLLILPDFAWTAIGTKWAFEESFEHGCPDDVVAVVRAAVIVGWLLQLALIVGIVIVFDPAGYQHSNLHLNPKCHSKDMWKLRCHLLCCCVSSNDQTSNAFEDLAQLLTDYFQDLDVVPTDVVAGLILIQHKQQQRPNHLDFESSVVNDDGSVLTRSTFPHKTNCFTGFPTTGRMIIEKAAHYMKFASACYGWPFFVFDNKLCGLCRLCCHCRCSTFIRPSNVTGDNCCSCNVAAIVQQTGIEHTDIVYASFSNRVYETPFYVAIDHQHHSIVVAVRGTLSFSDAITDLTVNADTVPTVNEVPDAKAHSGILRAASYIASIIAENSLLETAFTKAPGYQLVLTGHSLGAGTAAILAVLLRPLYSDLLCLAFSPPGWLVSLSLSQYMKDFVCSFVVGKDLVPRLGIVTMDHLKKCLIEAIESCHRPKYHVLFGGAWRAICCLRDAVSDRDSDSSFEQHRHLLSDSVARRQRQHYVMEAEADADDSIGTHSVASTNVVTSPQVQLFLPGCILHIQQSEPANTCFGVPKYKAMWSPPESFDEILVGARMITDHMPDVVYRALQSLCSETNESLRLTDSNIV